MSQRRPGPLAWLRVLAALAARPGLWWTAVRQARRMARRHWWAHPPFLPIPGPDYLAFRMETQYGGTAHRPEADDVIHYLSWCRQMSRTGVLPR